MSVTTQVLCECGCGNPAPIANHTRRERGIRRGQVMRFIHGHNSRLQQAQFPYSIEDRGFLTPCHIWQGALNPKGYGRVNKSVHGESMAYRAAYRAKYGEIPTGLVLDHLCRVRACVNPDHLEPVSNAENLRRGIGTKLTANQVAAIRADTRPSGLVAAEYGISAVHVAGLRRGRGWK